MSVHTTTPTYVSLAYDDIPEPDFADVIVVSIPEDAGPIPLDPAWWASAVFDVRAVPVWAKALFGLRQALVGLIGVSPGRRDVFSVREVQGEEALIAADDRHLDFRAAVGIDPARRLLRVTTTVRLHGWRGRLYFLPVAVLHDPITRAMATSAVARFSSRDGR